MEQFLKRTLSKEECVDHIDRNKLNDVIENLQILNRSNHSSLDAKRAKVVLLNCISCSAVMSRRASQVKANSKKGKAGPFCKSCGGKYGTEVQNGREEKLDAQPKNVIRFAKWLHLNIEGMSLRQTIKLINWRLGRRDKRARGMDWRSFN